jgi:8-oxo-dGTP diphosphatase
MRSDRAAPVSTCAVAVDVALLTIREGRLRLLLVEPERPELAGSWALPGRRVRDDESLDDTAHRALMELAGISAPDAHLEQLRTYGDPTRDPGARVVGGAPPALPPAPPPPTLAAPPPRGPAGGARPPPPPRPAGAGAGAGATRRGTGPRDRPRAR